MKTDPAIQVIETLKAEQLTLATAESCTGGGIGHALTAVPGSSAVYLGGVISYTNGVKEQVLGVPGSVLESYGAVSPQTAQAMAAGICKLLGSDIGISVTGLAGPDSDGSGKPVGLVYLGLCVRGETTVAEHIFSGDRQSVRQQAVDAALKLIMNKLH